MPGLFLSSVLQATLQHFAQHAAARLPPWSQDPTVHARPATLRAEHVLASAAIVEAVAAAIAELDLPLVVVDPVMVAKSGDRLLDEDALAALTRALLPLALVVTPNIPEAEALSGLAIASLPDAREAARRIHGLGPSAVVVKGGHREGPEVVDLLFDGHTFHEFTTPRIETRNTHGTGCTFASAVTARLALGDALPDAVARAQSYVETPLTWREELKEIAEVTKTKIRDEQLDGHPCVFYRVLVENKLGDQNEVAVWEATDLGNFPLRLRFETPGTAFTIHFRNVCRDEPDVELFQPPAEYSRYTSLRELSKTLRGR